VRDLDHVGTTFRHREPASPVLGTHPVTRELRMTPARMAAARKAGLVVVEGSPKEINALARKLSPPPLSNSPTAKGPGGYTYSAAVRAREQRRQQQAAPPPPSRPPPKWSDSPPGSPPEGQNRLAAAGPPENAFRRSSGSPEPLTTPRLRRSYRASDERTEIDRHIEAERAKIYEREKTTANAVAVFRSSLTPGQLAAQVVNDFNPFAIAEHFRLYGARGRRGTWS
jgi:hypothetical protein